MKILVTGATGFVGRALIRRLAAEQGFEPVAAVRRTSAELPANVATVLVGDLAAETDYGSALAGVDVVIHLAARVHVMRESAADPLAEFRCVNVDGTLTLARQAAALGVRRFVFLSSVKVNGEEGAFRESDPPTPQDAYGISKHEAEIALRALADETGMEVVIIRPPLVYGPGVRANFRQMMRVVARGIPLPFGAVHNRRSLIAVDNLADFVVRCVDHPAAANEVFLVSDGEDLSTSDLLRRLAAAMNRPARLIPVPAGLLLATAVVLGKRTVAQRLLGSLQVDSSKARSLLGWTPPVTVDEALREATRGL